MIRRVSQFIVFLLLSHFFSVYNRLGVNLGCWRVELCAKSILLSFRGMRFPQTSNDIEKRNRFEEGSGNHHTDSETEERSCFPEANIHISGILKIASESDGRSNFEEKSRIERFMRWLFWGWWWCVRKEELGNKWICLSSWEMSFFFKEMDLLLRRNL